VWAVPVVVGRVELDQVLEVASAEDERAIEALAPDGSHRAFRLRVRIGRLHRRPDDLDPFQPKIASTQLENLLSRSWIRNRNDR